MFSSTTSARLVINHMNILLTATTTTHGTIHKSCNRKQNFATGSTSTVFFGLRHKNETAKNMKTDFLSFFSRPTSNLLGTRPGTTFTIGYAYLTRSLESSLPLGIAYELFLNALLGMKLPTFLKSCFPESPHLKKFHWPVNSLCLFCNESCIRTCFSTPKSKGASSYIRRLTLCPGS